MTPADDRPDFEPPEAEIGDDWFERLSPRERAEHLAAVDRGLADIAAGRTVAWEDVKRWMLSWGTENELPRPRSR